MKNTVHTDFQDLFLIFAKGILGQKEAIWKNWLDNKFLPFCPEAPIS